MVGLSADDVETFLQCLDDKCAILNSTVAQRSKFIDLIQTEKNLQVIVSIIVESDEHSYCDFSTLTLLTGRVWAE